jgi:chromosomal replication initiation ATPase DnaA
MSAHENNVSMAAFKPEICICPTCGHPVARRGNLVSEIQVAVADYFDIPLAGMLGPSRRRNWARPRHVAMYLSRELTKFSIDKIARIFARDPSTVSQTIGRIEWLKGSDPRLRWDIVALRWLIDGGQ